MAMKTTSGINAAPKTLEEYLALPYRLEITPGDYGSYVVRYPDLPGCVTQVERLEDAIPMAREILEGWLAIALEDGQEIPLPRETGQYGGKILIRVAKSLHQRLAEEADEEGVSLNAYIATLLASGTVWRASNRQFDEVCAKIDTLHADLSVSFAGVDQPRARDRRLAGLRLAVAA